MKITQLKVQVKNPERVSVFVDGKYNFSLSMDQVLSEGLKKDLELDESDIKRFKKLSEEGKLKARALEWLLSRPRSVSEFRSYMYKKSAEADLTNAWQEEFLIRGYLDQERFASWLAELKLRKNKSTREVRSILASKGVEKSLIDQTLLDLSPQKNEEDELQDSSDIQAIRALVEKLSGRPRYRAEPQKLIAYLQRKGFRYHDIKTVLSQE